MNARKFCGHFFVHYNRWQKASAGEISNTDATVIAINFSSKQLCLVS